MHLSDFHFGLNLFEQAFSSKKLIEAIRDEQACGNEPDFVFITGDIANKGSSAEYKIFSEHIISPLIELFGSDFIDRIFVIPGNHDLDRNINDGFSKDKFLKPDGGYFDPTKESATRRQMVAGRFENFCNSVPCASAVDFSFENGAFSLVRQIGSKSVAIIGLNTAWLCDGEKDRENLTPGVALARSAIERHSEADIKFVLGHHPLDWIHFAHRPPLESIFAKHNVIYLHGHMHTEGLTTTTSGAGEFIAIQSGAAWQAPEGGKWKNGFMWGCVDVEARTIILRPYNWNFNNQCWTLDGTRFHENNRAQEGWIFDAPKKRTKPDYTSKKRVNALTGWEVKDLPTLERYTQLLNETDSIAYFDGATPTWAIALSDSFRAER